METLAAVTAMSALAHEGRLNVLRRLIKAGPAGLAVGALVAATGLNFSTVSAQLLILTNANLVSKERQGRSFIYTANYSSVRNLIVFLMQDCCQGNADIIQPLVEVAKTSVASCDSKGTCQ